MSTTDKSAEKFMELMQRYICLRPQLILPEHIVQFRKKMEGLKESGNSPEDYSFLFRILILLAQSEKAVTMSELGTELNVPMSTATRIVDWLVRGDIVERVNDPNDRRVVRVHMSPAGCELYDSGMAYNKQRIVRLLKDFNPEEQTQLLTLMTKLFDSLLSEK
jgi:DNA-binding MarR family transcriptional regulator